jgi:glycosyltransferase involved in cell wall biosynthesis
MNSQKTIFISYDGMTDPLGQSQVLPYLNGIAKNNYEIHLISFEKPEKFAIKEADIRGLIKNTSIIWHPLVYHQKPPVLSTLFDIWQLNKKVKEITSIHHILLIHCRSYISSLVGLSYKRKTGTPFIFDMRGFWADERIDGKIWNLKNPIFRIIYNYFKTKEKHFIEESIRIVSLTENAKNEILSWNNKLVKSDKIQVIPCCADLDHFSLKNINNTILNEIKNELGIDNNDYIISYVGSLGTWYMIDEMMDFFKVAQAKIKNCKFLLVTADNPNIAYDAAQKININTNSLIIKKAERKEVPYLIALSKFSMFFIKPAYSKKASSPTKLAEILGMGVPVICNANVGDVETIVESGKVGFVVKAFNAHEFESAINKMLNFLPANNESISNYANKYASLQDGVYKYLAVYDQIINTKDGDKTHL